MRPFDPRGAPLADRLTRSFQIFAAHKLSGAGVLLLAAAVAMAWANSPWAASYERWLQAEATVSLGGAGLAKSLRHWINDGLMGLFFFVVGLEIKRELLAGELSSVRTALLPVFAAAGGMAVPAALYYALNHGTPLASGWGVPMATDIAFALGILAAFPVPVALKVFLTALAIVDDIGAVVVVAVFYSDAIVLESLLAGGLLLGASIGANAAGVRNPIAYFLIGAAAWLAFYDSGVHATLAAVLMAFTIPARSVIDGRELHDRAEGLLRELRESGLPAGTGLLTKEQHHLVHAIEQATERATAPLQELEHALMPVVTYLVLPAFALANAGIAVDAGTFAALGSPMGLGIVLGLVVGNPVGVLAFSWAGIRLGLAELPRGVTFRHIASMGFLAGVGFTMSLFIATLAFPDPATAEAAKAAVLTGSLISAVLGATTLLLSPRPGEPDS